MLSGAFHWVSKQDLKLGRTKLQSRALNRREIMRVGLPCCTRFLSFAPLDPPSTLLQSALCPRGLPVWTCTLQLLVGVWPMGTWQKVGGGKTAKHSFCLPMKVIWRKLCALVEIHCSAQNNQVCDDPTGCSNCPFPATFSAWGR